jgi:hypothetical protein
VVLSPEGMTIKTVRNIVTAAISWFEWDVGKSKVPQMEKGFPVLG